LVPSFDGGDDFAGFLGPAEGTWVCVGFSENPLDRGLQFNDGAEDTAF
jgi:hypothetical protein